MPRPAFVNFILAFALQLRKKHGKTSVRVRKPQKENPSKENQGSEEAKNGVVKEEIQW